MPGALEINGVRQDETNFVVQNVGRDEVCNLAIGAFRDPVVNRLSGLFGLGKIDLTQSGSVVLVNRPHELWLEVETALRPQAIRHIQPIALVLGVQNGVVRYLDDAASFEIAVLIVLRQRTGRHDAIFGLRLWAATATPRHPG